eukprot:1533135-Karenia_brevis.AAC.1
MFWNRQCTGAVDVQSSERICAARGAGPWRGRGHAGPGTARPRPAPRLSAGGDCCHLCPRAELLTFPEGWR